MKTYNKAVGEGMSSLKLLTEGWVLKMFQFQLIQLNSAYSICIISINMLILVQHQKSNCSITCT